MKFLFVLTFFFVSTSNVYAIDLRENENYIAISENESCEGFELLKSENKQTPSWFLGPRIIMFEPGYKSTEQTVCSITKETNLVNKKWIQTTRSQNCKDIELQFYRLETLEESNNLLIYSSEITYDNQKDQVQKLSCRYKKKAVKN
tara:strand:+ start:569 stop:1006 length:438 start_codon:yes stop_codon:yes gene_type:complete